MDDAFRTQSYRPLIESVLSHKRGTWALSSVLDDRSDRVERKMLTVKVMGLTWKHNVTNEDLDTMCGCLRK